MPLRRLLTVLLCSCLSGVGALSAAEPPPAESGQVRTAGSSHWAFQPVSDPRPPEVEDSDRLASGIDRFVAAKLAERGMRLSPPAERRTLIRRATIDLLGIPPPFEDVQRFVNDPAPDAFARLVDRLLASPRYGERWARHWLDVARYADTKGYVFAEESRYPFAYTYRDYVIRAFNEDLPYDRFVLEQLAADQLEEADGESQAALGFLTVGQRFRNKQQDIIDDRIDVVTRGLMGLTIHCARCHDHKYDPIPTEDYYSLYGVFANCYEPDAGPLVREPRQTKEYLAYKSELDKRQAALDDFVSKKHRELLDELRRSVGDYLLKIVEEPAPDDNGFGLSFSKGEPRPRVIRRWRNYLARTADEKHPVFAPWHALSELPEEGFAAKAVELIEELRRRKGGEPSGGRVNPLVVEALQESPPESMTDVARIYGKLLADVYRQWQEVLKQSEEKTPSKLPDAGAEELRQVLYGKGTPTALRLDESDRVFDRATRNTLRDLRKEIEQWRVNSPGAPPRAMVLYDKPRPEPQQVFIRGNARRRGAEVPRRFPRVLSGPQSGPFEQGSGRLELARRIVDPENPLTARVLVNRVWMHHFGEGLVRTPSDFGTRSEGPSHPKLLDFLARRFIDDGFSIKRLHRRIMLSAVYRQSSDDNPEFRRRDPENLLLWRMNRRRLGFEAMRDSLLAASGRLDSTMGGRSVDLQAKPFTRRRTIYGFVDRNNLPGLFRTFDFANPDASTPQRPNTTVPQQALYGMNGEFVIEQARALSAHPDVTSPPDTEGRITALYRRVLARDPDPQELRWGRDYIEGPPSGGSGDPAKAGLTAWERYAQALLLTNEFLFVD